MRVALFFSIFVFYSAISVAQKKQKVPSQKEIEKQMKALESNPEIKAAMKQAGIASLSDLDETSMLYKIPAKKTSILIEVEKVKLSSSSLKNYLSTMKVEAWSAIPQSLKTEIDLLWQSNIQDTTSLNAAIGLYYKGKPKTALAFALKASSEADLSPAGLSNLAALLNLNGLPQKAIPILIQLQTQFPTNTTVLNNLAQAYLALGEVTKAESLLLKAASLSPTHVEANKSLAIIYRSRSQLSKAKACIQKSLEGGFSEKGKEIAEALGLDDEAINESVIKIYKDYHSNFYFNYFKYELPPFSESVADGPKIGALHKTFQDQLEIEIKKYEKLIEEESAKMEKSVASLISQYKNNGPVSYAYSPMFQKAKRMLWFYATEFSNWGATEGIKFFMDHAKKEMELKKAEDEEKSRIYAMNLPDNCAPLERVQDKYLPLYAANDRDYISKWQPVVQQYLTDISYWFQYTDVVDNAGVTIYGLIKGYLEGLHSLSRNVRIGTPICNPVTVEASTANADAKKKPDCPFSMEINLVVAKMTADCSKFGLEVNAGVSLSYEKNFEENETTLAIGIGLGFQIPENLPILDLSGSVKASEQLYIVFNGENQPSDLGFRFKAGVSSGIGVSGAPGSLSFENATSSLEGGYDLSLINSTIKFEGGTKGVFQNVFNK